MKTYILGIALVLMALATAVLADWSRDITYQDAEPSGSFAYLGIQGIHDGPVVTDAVPTWPGKEILQATRTSIVILRADNGQTLLELSLPDPAFLRVDCAHSPDGDEFVAGQPAVGDVDNDGDNDIVVGVTYKCEWEYQQNEWLLDYYSSVVWWTWNGTGFDDPRFLRVEEPDFSHVFLGTPTICRTQWTNGGATAVFWGPSSLQVTSSRHSGFILTAFDLSDPDQPGVRQVSETENVTTAQVTWALGSGIYVQAADLNGDGYDELIAHHDMVVYRFDWNEWNDIFIGTTLYTVPDGNAFQSGHGVIADVNADGSLEYLVSYSTLASPPTNGRLVQINLAGTVDWAYGSSEQNAYPIAGSQPGVCDLSRHPNSPPETPEGRLSPITSTRHDSRMYNSATGVLRAAAWPNFQLYYPNDQRNVSNPALAYVTGTPVQPQFIKVDIGYPTVGTNEIRVYDAITGAQVYSANLDVPTLYTADPYSSVTSSPAYCDLDGNGEAAFVTSFRTGQNTLRILRTDPGHAFNPELVEWQQFQNGPQHTGLYAQPVTGIQPRAEMKWAGRIIVHGYYQVNADQTLTIEPGTVVEFRPGAALVVLGNLYAEGTAADSIYFKPDGTSAWNNISLLSTGDAYLEHCVLHKGGVFVNGGTDVRIRFCRISNADVGIDVTKATALIVENNRIHDCTYGIRGTEESHAYRLINRLK